MRNPKTLKNFNVFINGVSYAGLITEFTPPEVVLKIDSQSGGRVIANNARLLFDSGITASFGIAEFSGELHKLIGTEINLTAFGTLSDDVLPFGTTGISISITGVVSSYTPSKWEAAKKTDDKYDIVCSYFRFSGNGSNIMLDVKNQIFSINGIDIVETIRGQIRL